jgi:hypothetical protein
MTINICRNEGFLGSLSITPETKITTEEVPLEYTISVTSVEEVIDLSGEFIVESTDVISGELIYNFQQSDRDRFKIKETETGFTFEFSSNTDVLNFNILNSNFLNNYSAKLIVDASSSGFGRDEAALVIQSVAASFGFGTDDVSLAIGDNSDISAEPQTQKISENISLINEYNFYIKEHEESNIIEANLLDINRGYSTADIKRYFANSPFPLQSNTTTLYSNEYMKNKYPILDKQKNLFPMYMEIKFQADIGKTQLVTFLEKLGMLDFFCYSIIYNDKDIKNFTITDLLSVDKFTINDNIEKINRRYIGDVNKIRKFSRTSFEKIILLKILEKQISDLSSLISDQILMYKLEKFKNNILINTQYFINNFENLDITAFDTQVKYNIEYEYKISKIETSTNGDIKTTEMPEYSIKSKIVDSPPLFPDVSFIPFKGVDNQILINLNSNSGRYSDYPIIIKDTDQANFDEILNNKTFSKLPQNNNKIQFETDDIISTFELFRLETPPKSYSDFKNGYTITTNFTSILDDIKPNTKYYYTLRAKDVHGNLSNPTKPIEIEIVNENGTIFLLKKEYIFKDESKLLFKTFKNILQIKPAKQQTLINNKSSYNNEPFPTTAEQVNMVLGESEISLWNKQFLMRVTSKETGKKIDIKFKFTYSQPT